MSHHATTTRYTYGMNNHDPLQPHSHDNNEVPPNDDPTITVVVPDGATHLLDVAALQLLPQTTYTYEYHTDHGVHGPYALVGVALRDLVDAVYSAEWQQAEIISADGFGNRVSAEEVYATKGNPILLCYQSDETLLTRQHGLIRLVVPSETDNALRQVKWVATIRLVA